ncbi:MAG: hypothetical protein DRG87_08350 [Deltaproteobacteria bacterium]|nr:MAG: hypothetical protein DRG87_08350 [Deltaproteobacteria bacterium]
MRSFKEPCRGYRFPHLVAAVSNAGGLGILGAAFMSPEQLKENTREIKARTDKPFGVNSCRIILRSMSFWT